MTQPPDQPANNAITLGERIAAAVLAAIAASLTVLGYFLFNFALASRGGGPPAEMFDPMIFKMLASLVGFGAVAGFCLGGTRLAEALGYFWGTSSSDLWQERWFKLLMFGLAVLLLVWAVALIRHFAGLR